jgi:hypothetical protein
VFSGHDISSSVLYLPLSLRLYSALAAGKDSSFPVLPPPATLRANLPVRQAPWPTYRCRPEFAASSIVRKRDTAVASFEAPPYVATAAPPWRPGLRATLRMRNLRVFPVATSGRRRGARPARRGCGQGGGAPWPSTVAAAPGLRWWME